MTHTGHTAEVRQHGIASRHRLLAGVAAGTVAAVLTGVLGSWSFAGLVGWDVGAAVVVIWTWYYVWPMDAQRTAAFALREDPTRAVTDLILLCASLASLVGVGFALVAGGNAKGAAAALLVLLAVMTVLASWSVVHTTFMLQYARLYYTGQDGGIDFNEDAEESPQYSDFAYVAFTIGMTFQVSDTEITRKRIRAAALRHALLSYLFGVVIIAMMINVVAGLTR